MSKKFQKRRRAFPWPLFVFGILLIAAAAFIYLNGKGGTGAGTPQLAVDRELIDFGNVKLDDMRAFTITVMNTGDGTLRFKEEPNIEVREGC